MISSAIWDESAQVNFSMVNQIAINFVAFEKFRVLIYPKLHEKNSVITC